MLLYLAAALIVVTSLAHSYLGERYLLMRLLRRQEQLPRLFGGTAFTAGTLRFAWHLTTLVWWGMAYLIALAAQRPLGSADVLNTFGVVALLSAALPLFFTRGRHLSWLPLLVVAALLFLVQ
ncbi:hypothetical protein G8A07_23380 [Roseateles sp. DAIF2]|uniref:hypothetical protein n=1 Tax=Roseateles sp. DAIF2 TaxID=2714952 RepID=UPI0018A2D46D|nr:hypothetical protein [Roseateles sp. DAIF2]QPF75566.1 hypothetical protein G8A07_23380 [Roseateles sp. DAIF2]